MCMQVIRNLDSLHNATLAATAPHTLAATAALGTAARPLELSVLLELRVSRRGCAAGAALTCSL